MENTHLLTMDKLSEASLVSMSVCYPPSATYLQQPNGTMFNGGGDWALANIMGPRNIPIEFNIKPSKSNKTSRFLQTLFDGRADVFSIHISMTHSRYQYVDFSPSLQPHAVKIMSRKFQSVMGSVIKDVFDTLSYGMIALSVVLLTAIFFLGTIWGHGFNCGDM